MTIVFPEIEEVLQIHRVQIRLYGGDDGLRDEGLLRLAIAMPQSTFGGQWLHEFPHGMAAALLFHICANHPFTDGNKRTAFATALLFLDVNGFELEATLAEAEELVLSVARGEREKDSVVDFFRGRVKPLT